MDSLWGVGSIGEADAKKTLDLVITEGKESEKVKKQKILITSKLFLVSCDTLSHLPHLFDL